MSNVSDLQAQTAAAAQAAGVPANIYLSLINSESSFNPLAVGSPTGSGTALGIAQLMPATAAQLGVTNAFDPNQALPAGANLLKSLFQKYGNWQDAIAAYKGSPSSSLAQSQAASVLNDASVFGTGDTGDVTTPATSAAPGDIWNTIANALGLGSAVQAETQRMQAAGMTIAPQTGASFFQKYAVIGLEIIIVVGLLWFGFSSLLQSSRPSINIGSALKGAVA